jgi:hypothetical protein
MPGWPNSFVDAAVSILSFKFFRERAFWCCPLPQDALPDYSRLSLMSGRYER